MSKKETSPFVYENIYPSMRHGMSMGRKVYNGVMGMKTSMKKRPKGSSVIPDNYTVCNTQTIDSDIRLDVLEGNYPDDINGFLYICQCLGVPEAFMVGDTNIVRMDFNKGGVSLRNRLMWTPAAMARYNLEKTKHRFDYFGLMYLSPGLGMFSYTEGMYLLPDGRLAVTSDVDRPWVIDRDTLRAETPVGRRDEWLPMMADKAGEVMGNLFAGYSNSHVMYTDREKDETFLVSYQYKQADGSHPVKLIRWDGYSDFKSWMVVDENGQDIEIKQSIHELVFTRDYIILADTAFVAGTEMLTPWKNAPLPNPKTVVFIVDRRDMTLEAKTVTAKKVEVDEACIHLISEYENPEDVITLYMLHTPATNTAEIMKSYDRDLEGNLFSNHTIGYGTLPVLDLSSVGKHIIDMKTNSVSDSDYISEMPYCWGPYLYTYMGRQIEPFNKQDLFIMFKGFSKDVLPERIYKAYKDVDDRRIPIEDMIADDGLQHNNSICRITTDDFRIADAYVMPDKVLLYTITCLESSSEGGKGYVLAGIVTDDCVDGSSGHEYWLFDAGNLASGPVCKLGHESLCNSTIFHTVYIPEAVASELDKKEVSYHVPLREDYPLTELEQWRPCVRETFEELIWPYYDKQSDDSKDTGVAEKKLKKFSVRRHKEHIGKEYLIGESYLEDAGAFADSMIKEADRMFRTTGWKIEYKRKGILVESKPVSGPLESSGVLVTRCEGEVDAPAKETFEMLISPEGYAVIDPVSKEEDHKEPPLEVYPWRENARLEAALATTNLPMMAESEFVVLNAIDPAIMTFASKSILHEKVPGGSKYSEAYEADGKNRALNTFVIKVEAVTEDRCRVMCINYADIAGKSTGSMNNMVNTQLFFPALYKRIAKKMK